MDILLRKKTTGQILAVLDTKYKRAAQLDPADVSPVRTYAAQTHAPTAILVYPSSPKKPLDGHIDEG